MRKKTVIEEIGNNAAVAKYIAMVVRNAMEEFHVQHLSDAQMKELNPIIRNAIFTALEALKMDTKEKVDFVGFSLSLIPGYWEEPVLLNEAFGADG